MSSLYKGAKDLFIAALERDEAERDAFLADACGDDTALREEVESLLRARPTGNVAADVARDDLVRAVAALPELTGHLDAAAHAAASRLHEAHIRARQAGRRAVSGQVSVVAHTPADVLGIYLYLPAPGSAR